MASIVAASPLRESCVVDESNRDPALVAVRRQLIDAVAAGRIAKIAHLISPTVRLGFAGLDGREEFLRRMEKPSERQAFLEALNLGGRFEHVRGQDYFWAPFSFTEPGNDADEDRVVALVRPLPVLRTARANAQVVSNVMCGSIMVDREAAGSTMSGWLPVRVGGRKGFVEASLVRSPTDHRVGFIRTSDGWRVGFFVAGD
jgi:hypothetical protein